MNLHLSKLSYFRLSRISAGIFLIILLYVSVDEAIAQEKDRNYYRDSIVLSNNDYLKGRILRMDKNILTYKTRYSKDDFSIKWDKVSELYTNRFFITTLQNGARYIVKLNTDSTSADNSVIMIYAEDTSKFGRIDISHIVHIERVNKHGRINAGFDLGYNFTSSNKLSQASFNTDISYFRDKWRTNFNAGLLSNSQEDANSYLRIDASLSATFYLRKAWLIMANADFLTNEEQHLKRRNTNMAGYGRYIKNSNMYYILTGLGLAWNNEEYSNTTSNARNSMEIYSGTEVSIVGNSDVDFNMRLNMYPGISDWGRFRSDLSTYVKYKLPLNFYIKLSFSFDYDSRPATDADQFVYVLQTAFGWKNK
ncbi:MAG: DUF481 domain-containing protein [Bacteroidales bacterium]